MKESNRILYAYCNELKECIYIDDVRPTFFNMNIGLDKFTFECADDNCRDKNHPEILAPNHNKFGKIAPYFRSYRREDHIPECSICAYSDAIEKVIANKNYYSKFTSRNLVKDFKTIDSASVYDDFKFKDLSIINNNDFRNKIINIKKDPIQEVLRGRSVTHSLRNLVRCYLQLKEINQLETPLTVEGHAWTYKQAFKYIGYIKSWFTYPYIYHSPSFIQNRDNLIIIFGVKTKEYIENNHPLGTVILINYDEIKNCRHLRNDIDTAIKNKNSRYEFYVMGRHSLKSLSITKDGEKTWVVIEPNSYQSLVIREVEVKTESETIPPRNIPN